MPLRNPPPVLDPRHTVLIKQLRSVFQSSATSDSILVEGQATRGTSNSLIGLMMPFVMLTLNMSMIGVALPSIRDSFGADADLVAWVVIGYTLPYVIFMPLYGRLGDALGKRLLFMAGVTVFVLGTAVNLFADRLPVLMLGRAIQGAGAAGIAPLAIAMISEFFPAGERGGALGTWNSIGPAAGMVGGFLAGPIIDILGWRSVFIPVSLVGLAALLAVRLLVPVAESSARPRSIHRLDWGGALLLGASITSVLFYISSKPITGVAPLRDWRLLAVATFVSFGFILWERRQAIPFVALDIFVNSSFTLASLCVAVRMFTMSGITFLAPLYLADVKGLSAITTGLLLVAHSAGLFVSMRVGGHLSDRLGSRRLVVSGITLQLMVMIYFALLSDGAALGLVMAGLIAHGLSAGLSLPALHRAAMGGVARRRTGIAAGLYSMIRFCGTALGAALGGVVLQQGLDRGLQTIDAYHTGFWFFAGVALLGVLAGLKLQE